MDPTNLAERCKKIKLLILDVDGVLTNGDFLLGPDGKEYKSFNTKDGQGIRLLLDNGFNIAIITGRQSEVVSHRANDLGIQHVYQGQRNKGPSYQQLLSKLNLSTDQSAYIGDDWTDLSIMQQAGLAIAVNDARPETRQYAHWITPSNGGAGAVRDACELLLNSQHLFDRALQSYLN